MVNRKAASAGLGGRIEIIEKNSANERFTYYRPSTASLEKFRKKGCRYLYVAHWVSNLLASNLDDVSVRLPFEAKKYFELEIGIENFPQAMVYQLSPSVLFEEEFVVRLSTSRHRIGGKYLRIAIGTSCSECFTDNAQRYARGIARELAFGYGLGAASSMGLETFLEISGETVSSNQPILEVPPETRKFGKDVSSFSNVSSSSAVGKLHPNREAELLFDESLGSDVSWKRFLFQWMAFEAQIGNGASRKKFCEDELNSVLISEEVRRLHSLRGSIVHKGLVSVSFADLVSMLWLLRIAFLRQGELRCYLVNEYSEWLQGSREVDMTMRMAPN